MCLFFQFPVFLFKAVNVFANECDYLGIDRTPVMMGNVFDFFQKFFLDTECQAFFHSRFLLKAVARACPFILAD